MLEGPLKSWISHFLGQYVESESIHVSTKLWKSSERLKLENLTLKKSVIPAWLPFRLKAGFIGQFEADLPISAIFGSAAAKIRFVDVLIVLAPLRHDEEEQREEEESVIEQKMQYLENDLINRWNGPEIPGFTEPHESEGYFGVDGWIGRTITKLIDNLQIDIRNLHIRVEDTWFPSHPLRTHIPSSAPRSNSANTGGSIKYAAGISVSALSAVTTPSNWRIDGFDEEKASTPESSHLVFKLINALDLSVYVDPVALHFIHSRLHPKVLRSTLSRLREMGSKHIPADWWLADENVHTHRFLVAPITVSLKMTLNTAAQHSQTTDPRYDASFHLSKLLVSLDEEQLSILNLIIDSYSRHDAWRVRVYEHVKAKERTLAREVDKMEDVCDEYVQLWQEVEAMKKHGIEHVQGSTIWMKVITIERDLPFELIVSLRNRSVADGVKTNGGRAPYTSFLLEMGDAMGIPLPEINVLFGEGPTGLVLDITRDGNVVVARRAENGPAAKKLDVKPGLLLVRVNGKPLKSVFRFSSALDIQLQVDGMSEARVLTFRHPSVSTPEITPHRAVSKIKITTDDLCFKFVRAAKKRVLAQMVLSQPTVMIHGFGPDLFAFHEYDVTVDDFYVQNDSCNYGIESYCIASSVIQQNETLRRNALRVRMNYLHSKHPDAIPGRVNTYGSKFSIQMGSSVIVVDEEKITKLLWEWTEYCSAISYQFVDAPNSSLLSCEQPTVDMTSVASSRITTSSSDGGDNSANAVTASYSYKFKVDQVMVFVSAAEKMSPPMLTSSQPSYRSVLQQLVKKEAHLCPTVPQDWVRAASAIVLMQRFIRGWAVRKQNMVRKALSRRLWKHVQGDDKMGWLYTRDDTLAFRRWRRSWCHITDDGMFTIHTDGSGVVQLDAFKVAGCSVTIIPNAHKGPWGLQKSCSIMEIRLASGVLRMVFSSDSSAELEKWRTCVASSARTASRSGSVSPNRYRSDSSDSEDSCDRSDPTAAAGGMGEACRIEPKYSRAVSEQLLLGGFSDLYTPPSVLKSKTSSWISIQGTELHLETDVHRVSVSEQTAFHLYAGIQYLSVADHRKTTNLGLLHLGDEFLALKNGVLVPARVQTGQARDGPFFVMNLSYRGSQTSQTCFVADEGLHVDIDVSGWFLPLNLYDVIFEVLDVVSVFWTDPHVEGEINAAEVQDAWFHVSALDIRINAAIIEAYLEDSNCVAKLSLEKSLFGYKADSGMENAKIHLGPTALFVLTDEVALRLAQVEKCWIDYDLRLQKNGSTQLVECELCSDESARRAMCHRSVMLSIGQVKLEADRRLELLFALLEAVTNSNASTVDPLESPSSAVSMDHVAKEEAETSKPFNGFDVQMVGADCMPTQRLQSMQFALDDPDLRPMYDHFGHQSYSPTRRSRISSSSTALNWQSQDNGHGSSRPHSVASEWLALLNYQVYIAILPPLSQTSSRTIFRTRLRVGRIHDRIAASCTSVVFEVIKQSLSVVALDTYIPVMNFSLGDMKILMLTRTEFTVDTEVDASVEMSARYYNSALADWEPFIEPWRTYGRVKSDETESGTSVQVSAMQRLNVNFTDALVRLLSSVARNRRKQVMTAEKRTPAAVAADGEAKKEDGRVCVLNNLGVPIRLANLNTSHPGTLHVEVRDGWSYPGYSRFHDVRVEVTLLPWWHPREAKRVDSIHHKFSLPYGGAQSGVTPILRVDVSTFGEGKRNFVFDQITNRYVEVEDAAAENETIPSLTQSRSSRSLFHIAREESGGSVNAKWGLVGSAEINLVGNVMGSLGSRGTKLGRWHRLHDARGNITGEIFVALEFVPHIQSSDLNEEENEPDQVKDGQFLVFDPLKILASKEPKSRLRSKNRRASSKKIVLSHGIRASYIPPLALEVIVGSTKCSLLCPLRRAGKFLIQGDKVLAEVKVAQRDESRRVLLLSSPVQLKNGTSIDMELWTCPTRRLVGEHGSFDRSHRLSLVSTSNKISIPLSAMYGEEKHSIVVKVVGCKPTVVAKLGNLSAGSSIIPLEPENGNASGYCLFVNTAAHMRKVYREEHQAFITRSGGTTSRDNESQSYATKYQIGLHACLVFENTLPMRVQFKVAIPANGNEQEMILRDGTLSPGDDVHLHEFHPNAQVFLRLPEMDSIWSKPLILGDLIYREGMGNTVKSLLGATGSWVPTIEFISTLQYGGLPFKDDDTEVDKVVARLDYTTADDGGPRVALFASLWIYNQSHVPKLLFRCADDLDHRTVSVPQLVPQNPVPKLMDCPNQEFEISTIINHEVSRWSDKIHSTVVGIQAPVTLKFRSNLGPKTRNELGIAIQRPLGQFHRTTQVIVTSRFVLVNTTRTSFKLSTYAKDTERVIDIPGAFGGASSSVPFDFDAGSSGLQRTLHLRMDHHGSEWSGSFAVDEEKEFVLKLRGNVEIGWDEINVDDQDHGHQMRRSQAKMHRVKIRIYSVGPTMVVSLMKDDPPMFVIRNESSVDLYVHQIRSSEDLTIIRSMEYIPYAWSKPDLGRRVSCRVGIPGQNHPKGLGARIYDFNDFDRDRGTEEFKFWLYGNQLRQISAEITVEESSRVLVFRDQNSERPPNYVLEVKVIAARFINELSIQNDPSAEIVLETDNHPPITIDSKELRTAHVYRFDSDCEFSTDHRPKKLLLTFFQHRRGTVRDELVSTGICEDNFLGAQLEASEDNPSSPTGREDCGTFESIQTPIGSPSACSHLRLETHQDASHDSLFHFDQDLPFNHSGNSRSSDSSSNASEVAEITQVQQKKSSGVVEIKIPRKAWSKFGVGMRRSIAWSHNHMSQTLYSMGRLEGHWWEMRDSETGELIGEVQIALKFRTSLKELTAPTDVYNVSIQIPSVGFSFLHNSSAGLVDVAYLSLQRLGMVYSCVGDSSEVAFSLGNLQMDNQMDAEVVLGPKVHQVKEGVSVRLRDRWRSFRNYQYRGIYEQLDTHNLSFVQFRMLWNSSCKAGDITHYELVEFIMQELEVSTDEKFVVNLITVFQGLGSLGSQHTFDEIANTELNYTSSNVAADRLGPVGDGVYIEELDIEAIRVKFSMELNGGRHIKTLGPSGRRLAVYLPESNVKDFRLYFSNVTYNHVYDSKTNVLETVSRRYQQQTVMLVLRGLHTVSVYANPFRIAYRFGHGVLEVVRLPARGLASGSPVELISGAYLGVRSLAMNTISAGYEFVAGATGILTAIIAPMLPDPQRRAFEDEMLGFQRAVIEEVDSFDAAEERTMTKVIVRKPRVFDPHGVGLLTIYGPGSMPMEEQDRIDHRSVVLLQQWWRRRRRASILYAEALRLRPELAHLDHNGRWVECTIM